MHVAIWCNTNEWQVCKLEIGEFIYHTMNLSWIDNMTLGEKHTQKYKDEALICNVACKNLHAILNAKLFWNFLFGKSFGSGFYAVQWSMERVNHRRFLWSLSKRLKLVPCVCFVLPSLLLYVWTMQFFSFICQVASARRQRSNLSVFESSCHLLLPV